MKDMYLMLGMSKQAHFQHIKRAIEERAKEPCYVGLMETIRQIHPGMGLRAMYQQFQPEGIGRDAFIALGLREGFRLKVVESPIKTTISVKNTLFRNLLAGLRVTNVNQVWVSDLFYFPLNSRHYYVVLIMDVYSRRIIGYSVADNMRAENNVAALRMAINLRGISDYQNTLIHHSDRGVQYTSNDYTQILMAYNIRISMCIDVLENAHSERVNGTIKNDYLMAFNIETQKELFDVLPRAIFNYNDRHHSSLPRMTPIQYETYVKELNESQRVQMTLHTTIRNVLNPNQLSLF
jgi:putative transposase